MGLPAHSCQHLSGLPRVTTAQGCLGLPGAAWGGLGRPGAAWGCMWLPFRCGLALIRPSLLAACDCLRPLLAVM